MATDKSSASWYNASIEEKRAVQFPSLEDTVYLDHAGTAIPAKSVIDGFAKDMLSSLCANPHSTSVASQETSKRIESIRLHLLKYFNADAEQYDLVFVANATAGIKLLADALRELDDGFYFGYHNAAHTSVVGMREVAKKHRCFASDLQVEGWLEECMAGTDNNVQLFAYPAQSNMNGRRLPLEWCNRIRSEFQGRVLTLLDAASLASTSGLDVNAHNPDFVVVSLYKIFGFPDLGALIVRKSNSQIFDRRRYFGGGTVDVVTLSDEAWHIKKSRSLHEQLEDGSLPIHNILALDTALRVHTDIFGDLDRISRHCAFLAHTLYTGLSQLRHSNDTSVCKMYHEDNCNFLDATTQGPIVALNVLDAHGHYVSTAEIEKLALIKRIQLRTGGLCNPGGVSSALGLSTQDLRDNYNNGQRCGSENDLVGGRPTGMVRLSIGPVNTIADVNAFLSFVQEFFVITDKGSNDVNLIESIEPDAPFVVESLIVYPIKSCAGWVVPQESEWLVRSEGLAWDREWCVVAAGSGVVMNQKRYPKMALIHPTLNLKEGLLCVACSDVNQSISPIAIPLYDNSSANTYLADSLRTIRVCDDEMSARVYTAGYVVDFFQQALGMPCFLARFPPQTPSLPMRHSKASMNNTKQLMRKRFSPRSVVKGQRDDTRPPILLSNESPILTISRSSLNLLNEQIKANGGRAVHAAAFRANIVLSETPSTSRQERERPYLEDTWNRVRIGAATFQLLGPCRRCQMVNVDQFTGIRQQEPFVTLAKTRRFNGMIFFGQHTCHVPQASGRPTTIRVGDSVTPVP